MMQHDDRITLRQIFDMAAEVIEFTEGRSPKDFSEDRLWCLAIERLLLSIGEASARLSAGTREQLAQIPWPQIIAFRNRVVHGYDVIDYDRVWQVLKEDMPLLFADLEKLDLPGLD